MRKRVGISISIDMEMLEFAQELANLHYKGNLSQAIDLLLRRGKVFTLEARSGYKEQEQEAQ